MSTAGKGLSAHGMRAAKVVRPGWGEGLAGWDRVCWLSKVPACLCHGQAGPGVTRFLGTEETCCCPRSWLSREGTEATRPGEPAAGAPLGATPCTCCGPAWAAPHLHRSSFPLCGGLPCSGCGRTPFPKVPRGTVFKQAAQTLGLIAPHRPAPPPGAFCLPARALCTAQRPHRTLSQRPGSLLSQDVGFILLLESSHPV